MKTNFLVRMKKIICDFIRCAHAHRTTLPRETRKKQRLSHSDVSEQPVKTVRPNDDEMMMTWENKMCSNVPMAFKKKKKKKHRQKPNHSSNEKKKQKKWNETWWRMEWLIILWDFFYFAFTNSFFMNVSDSEESDFGQFFGPARTQKSRPKSNERRKNECAHNGNQNKKCRNIGRVTVLPSLLVT